MSATPAQNVNIKRLYIGNLDATIDEYAIVKLFEPFGKITSIEVMVHWVGPKKGVPRGFCFLEYEKKEQSLKAINALHGKTVRGKNLVVSFAHMTPEQDEARKRGQASKHNRPNSLSILRASKMKNSTTDAKIQAIERKLKLLQQHKNTTTSSSIQQQQQQEQEQHNIDKTSKSRYKPY